MKSIQHAFGVLLCCLWLTAAQAQTYTINQLPAPQNLSPLFFGPLFGSGIYYGETPPNEDPKKPVLVFVHGFTDLANGWFVGNDMYGEAYRNGQNCAFVAMTRGQGMWVNGQLLASMLDHITNRFGVSKVVIVAHSNGGKASEVAMFWENRRNKVDRVITLGTPFKGTELANVAETPGFGWVVDIIGLGGGTSTSTTYYMGGYARPLLDWHWRNQPGKFINYGAWGYDNGSGPIGLTMTASGLLLNTLGSGASVGGNDGVTPYWSSTRPGGRPQWVPGHGNPVSRFNHMDVAVSNYVWNTIKPAFTAPLWSLRQNTQQIPDAEAITRNLESRHQWLNSQESQTTFVVEQDLREVSMVVLHEQESAEFYLERQTEAGTWVFEAMDTDLGRRTNAMGTGYESALELRDLAPGRYRLSSNARFAGVVKQDKGVVLSYNNEHQFGFDGQPSFSAKLERAAQYDLTKAQLTAVITLQHDLQGKAVETQTFVERFALDAEGNAQLVPSQHLPAGVYNMVLHAKHNDFQKTLITGFVVRENKARADRQSSLAIEQVEVFPNPASEVLHLRLETKEAATVTIYNLQGSALYQTTIQDTGMQQVSIDLNALRLSAATYFVEVQAGDAKKTTTFVVQP